MFCKKANQKEINQLYDIYAILKIFFIISLLTCIQISIQISMKQQKEFLRK